MACLDTTFLIDLARKRGGRKAKARAALIGLVSADERLCTTRFTVAELYVGVFRASQVAHERAAVAAVLQGLEILEFTPVAAETFGRLTARLQAMGKPAGDMDVLIASTAMAEGETRIVTRNVGHYADIPGITVVSY